MMSVNYRKEERGSEEVDDRNIVYVEPTFGRKRSVPEVMVTPSFIHQQVKGEVTDVLKRNRNGKVYISLGNNANSGEVIEVGKGRFQYKITSRKSYRKYFITRTDGCDITAADFLNIKKGDVVYFKDRMSGGELLEMYLDLHGGLRENKECEKDYSGVEKSPCKQC